MLNIKKIKALIAVSMVLVCILGVTVGLNEGAEYGLQPIPNRYSNTRYILAKLSIIGSNAKCSGYVTPNGTQSCTLVLKLYKKDGSSWVMQNSWTASSSGGGTASLSRTVTVAHGTYKVVATGYVDGEMTTATSKTVSY